MRVRRRHSIVYLGHGKGNAERVINEHVSKGFAIVSMWHDGDGYWCLFGFDEKAKL